MSIIEAVNNELPPISIPALAWFDSDENDLTNLFARSIVAKLNISIKTNCRVITVRAQCNMFDDDLYQKNMYNRLDYLLVNRSV